MRIVSIGLSTIAAFLITSAAQAQQLSIKPHYPAQDEELSISIDLAGSKWRGYSGDLYLYAGLVAGEDSEEVLFAPADSCQTGKRILMQRNGTSYGLRFVPSRLFDIPDSVTVNRLAFRLHSGDCSQWIQADNGKPFFIPLNRPKTGNLSYWDEKDGAAILRDDLGNQYHIMQWAPGQLRVQYFTPDEQIKPDFTSWSVVSSPATDLPPLRIEETDDKNYLNLMAGSELVAYIDKYPLRIDYKLGSRRVGPRQLAAHRSTMGGFNFDLRESEHFFGTGFRALPQDRRGWRLHTYNAPRYGYDAFAEDLNFSMPVLLSSNGYLLYLDNAQPGILDIGASLPDQLDLLTEGGPLSYYLIWGDDYGQIMERFTELVGRQPLPPRWALGYLLSRFGYESQEQALQIAKDMRDAGFDVDAMIFDLYWYGDVSDICDMRWDSTRFPDPAAMLAELREMDIMPVLINETFMTESNETFLDGEKVGAYCTTANGDTYIIEDFWAGPAALLDIFEQDVKDWFWDFMQPQMEIGVEGWWSDLGEPEKHPDDLYHGIGKARELHNVYGMEWARLFSEKYAEHYPEKRLFNLSRSGYVGFQRYSTFPWSGDVHRSWRALRSQIPIMLGMSMSGHGYMHSDAGGFAMGTKDPELYLRWLQLGVFNPIFRPHSDAKTAEPEPIFYDEETQKLVKDAVHRRELFAAYNYSLSFANTMRGEPITRPLFYTSENPAETYAINDQFFWGPNVMVAPILYAGDTSRVIHFPEGTWTQFPGFKAIAGGKSYEIGYNKEVIPFFLKTGTIHPIYTATYENTGKSDITMLWLPDPEDTQNSFELYEDDGLLRGAFEAGKYRLTRFEGSYDKGTLTFRSKASGNGYEGMPASREFQLNIPGIQGAPAQVRLNGKKIGRINSPDEVVDGETYYIYPESKHGYNPQVVVTIPDWKGEDLEIVIKKATVDFHYYVEDLQEPEAQAQFREVWSDPGKHISINWDVYTPGLYKLRLVDAAGNSRMLHYGDLPKGNHALRYALFSESGPEGTLILSTPDGSTEEVKVQLRPATEAE